MVFHSCVNLMPWELQAPPLRFPPIALRVYANESNSLLYDYFKREYNGVILTVPMKGKCPRTEFRQVNPTDNTKAFWSYESGVHYLKTKMIFRHIPEGARVIVGQVDEPNSLLPPVSLQYNRCKDKGNCTVIYRTSPTALPLFECISKDMKLVESFIYTIRVDELGEVIVTVNDNSFNFQMDHAWNTYQLYFKAGLHVQNDTVFDEALESETICAKFKKISLIQK